MKWTQRWAVAFGWLPSVDFCADLEAWLDENIRGWLPHELHAAIDRYAEEARTGGAGRPKAPTGPELKTLILRARYETRAAEQGAGAVMVRVRTPEGRIEKCCRSDLTQKLLATSDPEERWEIVCIPLDDEECKWLESYANSLPGGVCRFNPADARAEPQHEQRMTATAKEVRP